MTILDIIKNLNAAEDDDNLYVIAGCINLYRESIRRLDGRTVFGPGDAKALLMMLELLLTKRKPQLREAPLPRGEDLSDEEAEQVLLAEPRDLDAPEIPKAMRRH